MNLYPQLYDHNLTAKTRLQTAQVSYSLNATPPSTGSIIIDRNEADVEINDFVKIYNAQGETVGVFRVTAVEQGLSAIGPDESKTTITITHAISTLDDGVWFGSNTIGGASQNITNVINQILALQPISRWQLGTCDFTSTETYTMNNEDSLLTALLSLTDNYTIDFLWTFDCSTYPWTLNLTAPSASASCEMRMNRNIASMSISIDRTNLCTQMFPQGYDGLTIGSVNGGVPYLNDATAIAAWGVVASIWQDMSITDPAILKTKGQAQLDLRKEPTITISIDGLDLAEQTGIALDRLLPGLMCRIPLKEYNISILTRIVSVSKEDAIGNPTQVSVTLTNGKTGIVEGLRKTNAALKKFSKTVSYADILRGTTKAEKPSSPANGSYLKYNSTTGKYEEASDVVEVPHGISDGEMLAYDSATAKIGIAKPALDYAKVVLLWSGSWSSGALTVANFSNYTVFRFYLGITPIIVNRNGSYVRGGGAVVYSGPAVSLLAFSASLSGNTLTLTGAYQVNQYASGSNGSYTSLTVTKIEAIA